MRLYAMGLSICLFVCLSSKCVHKKAVFSKTEQFGAMVSIDDLYEVLHEYLKEPITGPLIFNMAVIRHLVNRQSGISQQ